MTKKIIVILLLVAILTPPAAFAKREAIVDDNFTLLADEQMSSMIGGEEDPVCGGEGNVVDDICEIIGGTASWVFKGLIGVVEFVAGAVKFTPPNLDEITLIDTPLGKVELDLQSLVDQIFGKNEESPSSTTCVTTPTDPNSVGKYDKK